MMVPVAMNSSGPDVRLDIAPCFIVGIGNPARRDDGVGRWMITALKSRLGRGTNIRFFMRHQLEPDLVEDLIPANGVIMIDATIESLPGGWRLESVFPDLNRISRFCAHTVEPGFILGLLDALYGRRPPAWVLAIQGDDFSLGDGLSPTASTRALAALNELVRFLSEEDCT